MKTKLLPLIALLLFVSMSAMAQETEKEKVEMEPTYMPAQISFVPGFGTGGIKSYQLRTNLSLNILGGYVHTVEGLELGSIVNIVHQDVKGAQFSGNLNIVGRNVKGAQMSGLANVVLGQTTGAQLSGLANVNIKQLHGGQLAGMANYAESVDGIQGAGLLNTSLEGTKGGQISGLANYSKSVKGIQAAGLLNIVSDEVDGAQVAGIINFAPRVKGLQIGLINIADTVESGAMIGLFNFVRKGMHKFEFSHDDVFDMNFSFRGGTERFYSIWTVGLKPQNQAFWSIGAGFGTQINMKSKFYSNIEATSNWLDLTDKDGLDGTYSLNRLNVNVGYKINDYLSVNAGPVLNVYVQNVEQDNPNNPLAMLGNNGFYDKAVNDSRVKMWMGYRVAFRF